jgi:hypothetical protein
MTAVEQSRLSGYAREDWNAIDYGMWKLAASLPPLRGPEIGPLVPGGYGVVLGAAQAFGRFCPRPFPALLSERIGMPVLNMGLAGAGPRMFMGKHFLNVINQAAFVVIQVMSGRSLGNSVFECPNNGGTLVRRHGADPKPKFALDAWRDWMKELEAQFEREERIARIQSLMEETRTLWVGEMALLREVIRPPTVLFWFSTRAMDYEEFYSDPELVFGDFPQLINARCMRAVQPLFEGFAEAVTSRGSPQPLVNRFTGEPHCINPQFLRPYHNAYYPSPEMQEDAAEVLTPAVLKLCDAMGRGIGVELRHAAAG